MRRARDALLLKVHHFETIGLADSSLLALIYLHFQKPMRNGSVKSLLYCSPAEASAAIHTSIVTSLATSNKLIYRDMLIFPGVLMKAPCMAQHILHHLQFSQIINVRGDVDPLIGHLK